MTLNINLTKISYNWKNTLYRYVQSIYLDSTFNISVLIQTVFPFFLISTLFYLEVLCIRRRNGIEIVTKFNPVSCLWACLISGKGPNCQSYRSETWYLNIFHHKTSSQWIQTMTTFKWNPYSANMNEHNV